MSKPVDKTNYLKLQANQQANQLIVSGLENDLNLLLTNKSIIHSTPVAASNTAQLVNIPITLSDPCLQFNYLMQQHHHNLLPLTLPALNTTQLNIPK